MVSHTSGTNILMSKNSRVTFHSKRNPFDVDDDDDEEEHVTHGFDPDEELPKERLGVSNPDEGFFNRAIIVDSEESPNDQRNRYETCI